MQKEFTELTAKCIADTSIKK